MTNLLFLLLLVLSFTAQAQGEDYVKYNKKIQKAEYCIVNSSYKKALKIYVKLYRKNVKTFVKDDVNAMTCALLLNDYENAVYFDKRRIQKNGNLREGITNQLKKKKERIAA